MMNVRYLMFGHTNWLIQHKKQMFFLLIALYLFVKYCFFSLFHIYSRIYWVCVYVFSFFLQAAVVEMTWVISDYTATPGTNEVSVTNRQQVEIIDTNCKGAPEYCLVRLNGNAADGSGTLEGLVPVSILKPAPSSKSVHRRAIDGNSDNKDTSESNGKSITSIHIT